MADIDFEPDPSAASGGGKNSLGILFQGFGSVAPRGRFKVRIGPAQIASPRLTSLLRPSLTKRFKLNRPGPPQTLSCLWVLLPS